MKENHPLYKLELILDEIWCSGWKGDLGDIFYVSLEDYNFIVRDSGHPYYQLTEETVVDGYQKMNLITAHGSFRLAVDPNVTNGNIRLDEKVEKEYRDFLFEKEVLA